MATKVKSKLFDELCLFFLSIKNIKVQSEKERRQTHA